MTKEEWNSHPRIAALMSGMPEKLTKLQKVVPWVQGGRLVKLKVPRAKFEYEVQMFARMP